MTTQIFRMILIQKVVGLGFEGLGILEQVLDCTEPTTQADKLFSEKLPDFVRQWRSYNEAEKKSIAAKLQANGVKNNTQRSLKHMLTSSTHAVYRSLDKRTINEMHLPDEMDQAMKNIYEDSLIAESE